VARPDTVAFSERDQVRRPWFDNYSADMSKKRPELPGTAGNAVTVKKVVTQGLSRLCRNSQEPQVGNPLVADSSPAHSTSQAVPSERAPSG
jgi:hypothetical protein